MRFGSTVAPASTENNVMRCEMKCADCGIKIGLDDGPPDGWQLEDGRTVCNKCCVLDTSKIINIITTYCSRLPVPGGLGISRSDVTGNC